MDQTAQDIKDREQQSEMDEPPEIADGDDSDDESSSLPLPSIDRRHVAVIGVILVAVVAWKLYQRRNSSSGSSIAAEREKLEKRHEVEAAPDEQEEERINVPIDPSDPLAADRAVLEALRNNGKLYDPDQ